LSKLRDNPAKVVPIRALMVASGFTVIIIGLSAVLSFNLLRVLLFFWLGAGVNLIAFRLIVAGADRMIAKQEAGEKATIIPNLIIRYVMYIALLIASRVIGGWTSMFAAFIGIQVSQIAIKLDSFVG